MSTIHIGTYTYENTGESIITVEADGNSRRERGASIAAVVRRYKAAGNTVQMIGKPSYDEMHGFLHRTTVRYRVTPLPSPEDVLLAKIEEHQARIQGNGQGDGMFVVDPDFNTLMALWNAGRIVPGGKTSGPGNKLGWYSVRMIDADHAAALEMDAAR